MTYLWVWRLASPAPLCDPPRLVLAGRLYQQTQQFYVLYMLRDKMGRRGFSDKTVKDYLSFGGPVVICYQNGFCVKKKEWQEWKEDGKGWKRGREVEAGGLKMAEGGGSCHAGKDFVFCLISCPLPPPVLTPPLSNEPSVSHILNLPGKHSGMIGAVSQSNVMFATGGTRERRARRESYYCGE